MIHRNKIVLSVILIITALANLTACSSTGSKNNSNRPIDTFYSNTINVEKYSIAKNTGKISAGRQHLVNLCTNGGGSKTTNCVCFSKALNRVSDREFFYESIQSYQQYQKQVQALNNNNKEKYKQLKKRKGLGQRLFEQCKKT